MPPRKKKTEESTPVRTHQHTDHQRLVVPDAGVTNSRMSDAKIQSYSFNPHLEPILRSDSTGNTDKVESIIEKD